MAAAVAASSRCVLRKWDESRLLGDGSLVEGIEVPGVDGADEMGMWCSGCDGPLWVSKWCCWAIRACIRCASLALELRFDSAEAVWGVAADHVRRRRLARRTVYKLTCVNPARSQRRSRAFRRVESGNSLRTSGHPSCSAVRELDGHDMYTVSVTIHSVGGVRGV